MGRKKSNRTQAEWAKYHADRQREYYAKNRAKIAARKMELYYERHRDKKIKYQNEYSKNHTQERNEFCRNKRLNDVEYALRCSIGSMVCNALTRNAAGKDGESVMKYLPYTTAKLKAHLESLFTEGMSWENRSEWHIDHIIPQSKLPYKTMDHPNFQKCWALSNLQPLWANENISKGNKI